MVEGSEVPNAGFIMYDINHWDPRDRVYEIMIVSHGLLGLSNKNVGVSQPLRVVSAALR